MRPHPTSPVLRVPAAFVVALAATTGAARACDPAAFDFTAYLADADRDGDGRLRREELLAAPPGTGDGYGGRLDLAVNTVSAFESLDADRDGRLTDEELWRWGEHTHDACADWNANQGGGRSDGWLQRALAWLAGLFD